MSFVQYKKVYITCVRQDFGPVHLGCAAFERQILVKFGDVPFLVSGKLAGSAAYSCMLYEAGYNSRSGMKTHQCICEQVSGQQCCCHLSGGAEGSPGLHTV